MGISITFSDLTLAQAQRLCHHAATLDAPLLESPPTAQTLTGDAQVIPPTVGGFMSEPAPVQESAPSRKRGRPRKVDTQQNETPSRSGPAEAGPPCVEPAGESAAGTSSATLDDVRAALTKVMGKHGFYGCNKVLKEFGATRMSEIPEAKYAEFVAAAEKAAL